MEDSKKINFKKYSSLEGDASFRKFYRKKNTNGTSIIVFANKEKEIAWKPFHNNSELIVGPTNSDLRNSLTLSPIKFLTLFTGPSFQYILNLQFLGQIKLYIS